MLTSCKGLIDEARVTVDVSLLERAAIPSPLLAIALVLSLVGLVLSLRAVPAGDRLLSLVCLLAPLGAFAGWALTARHSDLRLPCGARDSCSRGRSGWPSSSASTAR